MTTMHEIDRAVEELESFFYRAKTKATQRFLQTAIAVAKLKQRELETQR